MNVTRMTEWAPVRVPYFIMVLADTVEAAGAYMADTFDPGQRWAFVIDAAVLAEVFDRDVLVHDFGRRADADDLRTIIKTHRLRLTTNPKELPLMNRRVRQILYPPPVASRGELPPLSAYEDGP